MNPTTEHVAFALCAAYTVICGLDFWSTKIMLGLGGREMNPLVKGFIDSFGVVVGLLLAKTIGVVPVWVAWYFGGFTKNIAGLGLPPGLIGLFFLCAFFVWVVSNNFREIEKQRQINAGR